MIGQKNLIAKLKSFNLTTLPHSILLTGEQGSEQELVCQELASFYGLELKVLDDVSDEIISSIDESHVQRIYLIDSTILSENNQNKILKFFEEPSEYAYIVITSSNDNLLLDTIKTRSYCLKMDRYEESDLRPLCLKDPELTLSLCTTPGQVEAANHQDIRKMSDFCFKMSYMLDKMSFFEIVTVSDKINFNDEYDKFDLLLFMKCLKKWFKDSPDIYKIISHHDAFIWSMMAKLDGRKRCFDHMMIDAWQSCLQSERCML